MALKVPLVVTSGEVQQLQTADSLADASGNLYGIGNRLTVILSGVGTLNPKDIVYFQGGVVGGGHLVDFAKADDITKCKQLGMYIGSFVQLSGLITGLSGLTQGSEYWLSPTTAGAITTTVPSTAGQVVVKLGIALTSSIFILNIKHPILLS